MLKPSTTTKFESKIELAVKRGKDLSKLADLIEKLSNEIPLGINHRNHKLKGAYKGL